MRRLMLFRHAKAEPEGKGSDFDRALAGRGPGNARAIGAYMKANGLVPEFAAVSPARRAAETWKFAAQELGASIEPVYDKRIYGASENTLMKVIHEFSAAHASAVLVGHNPGLWRLAMYFAAKGPKETIDDLCNKFPTGALAVIDFKTDNWKSVVPGEGTLADFVTPVRAEDD